LKTRSIGVLMFSVSLLAFGCGSEKPSSEHVVSSSTGPNVGQKMPPFTGLDQFGQTISSETLKGTNGTVLLFFRSADW
jgi:cytochrome oxidase Cu insertion factor (SCO1/SenC/PrrC family)